MKKSLMAIAASVATVFCALPAAAQTMMSPQFYVGAGGGRADSGETDNAWKVYAGGMFMESLGIEAAYNDLGGYRGGDLTSWSLAGIGSLPLNPMWSVFVKAGVTSNRLDNGVSDNNTEPLFGAGVGLSFNRNLGLRLEYEDFGKTPAIGGSDDRVKAWALSVKYTF